MNKALVSSRAIIAALLLCLGLEKASAHMDPSVKPTQAVSAQIGHPAANCFGF